MSYPHLLFSQFRRDQRLFDINLCAAASSLSYTYLAPQCKAKERKKEKKSQARDNLHKRKGSCNTSKARAVKQSVVLLKYPTLGRHTVFWVARSQLLISYPLCRSLQLSSDISPRINGACCSYLRS